MNSRASLALQMKRVMTYLKLSKKSEPILGQFGQCVVSTFLKEKEDIFEVAVHCDLAQQGLILEHVDFQEKPVRPHVLLRHPPFCPMLHLLPKLKQSIQNDSGISVAVAVILESSDSKVLITRRPAHMRTFPNIWVPPGGGSENSETILDTGLREVLEETGLDVKKFMLNVEPLCLWESVYPALLAKGDPKRHQIVVYLHIVLNKNSRELLEITKLCPNETEACAWLDLNEIQIATDYSTVLNTQNNITIYELLKDGNLEKTLRSHNMLRAEVPTSGNVDIERISTGTRFALEQFYERKLRASKI